MPLRVVMTCLVVGVALCLVIAPITAFVIDRQTKVTAKETALDMIKLQEVVTEMGPDYRDVNLSLAQRRQRIMVVGTVPTSEHVGRLREALKAVPIKTSHSNITFDVKATGKQ